ncbi:2-dehydropantoate 2-reductase [Streptomyces sp. TS71-3]|nr:2-dehydropantoate 2-reductase [Streptomyces sp. TS71-3]
MQAGGAAGAGGGRTVAVLGPGGVGGLFAGVLARAGHRVICLAGEETATALRKDGLAVRSDTFGEFTVAVEADTVLREAVDACVVAPKETALVAALDRVPREALGAGLVVPLLNGFEHVSVLRERYPAEQVVPGTIRIESTRVAPGQIVHSSPFAAVDLASRTVPAERVAALGALLSGAGLTVRVRDGGDEDAILWEKLSFLAPMALLTTRYAVPVGGLRTDHHDEVVAVMEEYASVAAALGATIDVAAMLRLLDGARDTMRTSMQRDAEAGRPLELDAIGGAMLREADRRGLPTPVTARLVAELTAAAGDGAGGAS